MFRVRRIFRSSGLSIPHLTPDGNRICWLVFVIGVEHDGSFMVSSRQYCPITSYCCRLVVIRKQSVFCRHTYPFRTFFYFPNQNPIPFIFDIEDINCFNLVLTTHYIHERFLKYQPLYTFCY